MSLPNDLIPVGKIIDAFHLRGQVKAFAYSGKHESLTRLADNKQPKHDRHDQQESQSNVWIKPATVGSLALLKKLGLSLVPLSQPAYLAASISKAQIQGDAVVISLTGINDRTIAEALKSAEIHIPQSSLPKLSEAEGYYWLDLIGCEVLQHDGQKLGTVTGLLETGAHDILCIATAPGVVAASDTQELMIPFLERFVLITDVAQKRIVVDWPLGFQ